MRRRKMNGICAMRSSPPSGISGKTYVGVRKEDGVDVLVMADGIAHPLPERLDLREHSVNLEWAYGIGGPAQLALAILADATGSDAYAERHYHWFKLDVVARLAWHRWEMPESRVWDWIAQHHPLTH